MGIKNLNYFLKRNSPSCSKLVHLSDLHGKHLAIDIAIYLHTYKRRYKSKWMNAVAQMVCVLRKHNIDCTFIFDTHAPPEKNLTKQARRLRKTKAEQKIEQIKTDVAIYESSGKLSPLLVEIMNKDRSKRFLSSHIEYDPAIINEQLRKLHSESIYISATDKSRLKELLHAMGVNVIDSRNEGETLCAQLCAHNRVDAVLSDDTDVLAYGAPHLLTRFDMNKEICVDVMVGNILNDLNFTQEQFTDFCIMCGTDYNNKIPKMTTKKAYKLLTEYGSIEGIRDAGIDVSILNHERIREIFSVPHHLETQVPKNTDVNMDILSPIMDKNNLRINIQDLTTSMPNEGL